MALFIEMSEVVGICMLLLGVKVIAKVRVDNSADTGELSWWMDVVG